MTVYVGIDYDTHGVHIAAVNVDDPDLWWFKTVQLPEQKGLGRTPMLHARHVRARLGVLSLGPLWDEALEATVEHPFGHRTTALTAIGGAIISTIPARVHVNTMSPVQWRRDLLGLPGNTMTKAAKAASRKWCDEHGLADAGLSPDLCDAACIAYLTLQQSTDAANQKGTTA